MDNSSASKRKGIVGLGAVLVLALLAGVALATSDDAEVVRGEAANATSSSAPTGASHSPGTSSASPTSVLAAEPAPPEPVIPRTEPARGVNSTCETGGEQPGPDQQVVIVYFHCDLPDQQRGRTVAPVHRPVADSPAVLESALGELLRGPTEAERAAGFYSPFSEGTSRVLRRVAIEDGLARIDFAGDFRRIDNVGTTGVSGQIYGELNRTVFQFDSVTAIVYSLEGSEQAWCDLHEAECGEVVRRDT